MLMLLAQLVLFLFQDKMFSIKLFQMLGLLGLQAGLLPWSMEEDSKPLGAALQRLLSEDLQAILEELVLRAMLLLEGQVHKELLLLLEARLLKLYQAVFLQALPLLEGQMVAQMEETQVEIQAETQVETLVEIRVEIQAETQVEPLEDQLVD
jgi:hypothetical protein